MIEIVTSVKHANTDINKSARIIIMWKSTRRIQNKIMTAWGRWGGGGENNGVEYKS